MAWKTPALREPTALAENRKRAAGIEPASSAAWLVEQGWLARPRVFSWPGAKNSRGQGPELRRRIGDFDLEQAARAFGDRGAIGDAVFYYRRRLHPGTALCF